MTITMKTIKTESELPKMKNLTLSAVSFIMFSDYI